MKIINNVVFTAVTVFTVAAYAQMSPTELQARAELVQVQHDTAQAIRDMQQQASQASADINRSQASVQFFRDQAAAEAQRQHDRGQQQQGAPQQ